MSEARGPKVVITGATGFIGSHMVEYLLEKNYDIHCIIRKTSNLQWIKDKPIKLIEGNLFDTAGLAEIFKDAQFILHIAGVVKSKKEEGYYKGNVETTRHVLDAALENKVTVKKIVVISSLAASAPTVPGKPVNEETPSAPVSQYGHSKVAQEKLCAEYMDRLPITIIRPPGVYGPRDTEIFVFFKTFRSGILTKLGFNRKTVSLIFVKDLVDGIHKAMLSENAESNTYFLAANEEYDWDQIGKTTGEVMDKKYISLKIPHFIIYIVAAFAQLFAKIQGKASTLNLEKANEITQPAWVCSPAKAMRDFDFRENYTLKEGFAIAIDWYRKNGWL